MREPKTENNERGTGGRRVALALLAFLGVSLVGFIGSLFLGTALELLVERAIPHVVGEGSSITMVSFLRAAFPMAAFLSGLVAALFIWDPEIAPRTEAIGLIVALLAVTCTWVPDVLFSSIDTLYSVRALVAFELVGSALGIAALVLVFRWRVDRPTLIGIKAIAVFLITGFFVLAPLALATGYFLVKFEVPISLKADGWAGAFGGLLSVATSLVALGGHAARGSGDLRGSKS